ncbi:uncharacterized protein [Antedon mediterranea]|uniref:uncharacterized protein n=1 Tax=Antedon mediterranea TaxID=105859 RepID=UPI003AF883EC
MKTLLGTIYVCWTLLLVEANNTTDKDTNVEQTGSSFTPETVAALWAGFFGGLIAVFGIGMLFYQLKIRKYEEYKERDGQVAILPPVGDVTLPSKIGCCGQ